MTMRRLIRSTLLAVAAPVLSACWGQPAAAPTASAGALTIEVVPQTARNFDANYGLTRQSFVEFRVRHRGQAVDVTGTDGKPTALFRDAWVLAGAPRPAVLVGGAAWHLITDDDGRAKVATVAAGNAGTVQWLDAPGGLGPVLRSGLRRDAADARTLQGGRRLLLNGTAVLDVATLQVQPLSLDVPAGYEAVGAPPLGLSPDGRKLVLLYRGASNSRRDPAPAPGCARRRVDGPLRVRRCGPGRPPGAGAALYAVAGAAVDVGGRARGRHRPTEGRAGAGAAGRSARAGLRAPVDVDRAGRRAPRRCAAGAGGRVGVAPGAAAGAERRGADRRTARRQAGRPLAARPLGAAAAGIALTAGPGPVILRPWPLPPPIA
jgi:hypothetical protein